MIVVDTSVAARWVVQEAGREAALTLLDRDEPLIAPDRLIPELVNVLRRKLKSGQIVEAQFVAGVGEAIRAFDFVVPSPDLAIDAAALALSLDHSPYDCFFLACAIGRGILVSADDAFLEKARRVGFGNIVISLDELAAGGLDARFAAKAVDPQALGDIVRLAVKIEDTFKHLRDTAPGPTLGRGPKIISMADLVGGFESPAYVRLERMIESLDQSQLTFLLAIAWLGRGYYQGDHWPQLVENARTSDIPRDFGQHRRYILAQMRSVPAGLAKLRQHFNLPE